MSEFAIQRRVAKMILEQKPSMAAGVKLLFDELDKKYPKHDWKKCEKLAWGKLLDEWVKWLDVLVAEHKPPRIQLVWFETPESLDDAMTSISGWTDIGRKDEAWGADEDRVWPINEEGNTLDQGKFMMPLVDEAMEMGGWGDTCEDDAVQAAVHAIVYGVNLLLVLNGLPQSKLGKEQREPLGVTCGWASGDCDVVGGWVDGKWGRFPRGSTAKKAQPAAEDEVARRRPVEYLRNGGDVGWRDPSTGETLLHRVNQHNWSEVEYLVDAGVDLKAVDKRGVSALAKFEAAPVQHLEYLIKAGANPRCLKFYQYVIWDTRCTIEHLHLLERHGCTGDEVAVMAHFAEEICSSQIREKQLREILKYWVQRGKSVHTPNDLKYTPIWESLRRHAQKLSFYRFCIANKIEPRKDLNDGHDRVACLLIEQGANPNEQWTGKGSELIPLGATPLMVQRYDDTTLIKALLKYGANPNARCAKGKTALDYARIAAKKPELPGHEAVKACVAILEKVTKA